MGYGFPGAQQAGRDPDDKSVNSLSWMDDEQELCLEYGVTYNKDSKKRGP